MEYTLKLALQFSKREVMKYGLSNYPDVDYIWEVAQALYNLREDEKETYYKSMNKFYKENYIPR